MVILEDDGVHDKCLSYCQRTDPFLMLNANECNLDLFYKILAQTNRILYGCQTQRVQEAGTRPRRPPQVLTGAEALQSVSPLTPGIRALCPVSVRMLLVVFE